MTLIKDYLIERNIPFDENVDLKTRTWIHRGGIAEVFILPVTKKQLEEVAIFLYSNTFDFLVIGNTSNLYIQNTTNIPIVVSTQKCNHYTVIGNIIECEAGVSVMKLAREMISSGIKGFEYLTGLPGTVGAALVNNSSCRNNSISSLLVDAEVVTSGGTHVVMTPTEFDFKYRSSSIKAGIIDGTILSIRLRVEYGDMERLKEIASWNEKNRDEVIDGSAKNLGCTVNSVFSIGNMPSFYRILSYVCSKLLHLCGCKQYKLFTQKLLCVLSGCSKAAPYISKKNVIIFIWKDDKADAAFPYYLKFMKKVYRTDTLEIQII